jgi:chromosome segregation protein
MRIKKIEAVGFKSFADREVVVMDEHITGVIGPNGCGKSNIVDAIRWCLGEQRAKHLRGSGMSDVIFSGSSTRGPAGMAEVTIVFENEGDSPSSYLRFAEIAVTRRLYRDGTSEYLINKVPCRLRDINDMLTGTGVSSKTAYSIIEQGRVGQIVTSKPETRRQVIDEAAGITKFKQQKQQAEKKIEQTRQNLLRVTDVIGELEGRLGALKRQAQKAERYKRYRTELTDLELWMASHRFLELRATSRVLEGRRVELDRQVEDLRAESGAREARIEVERVALRELEGALSSQQQRLYDLENRIQLIEQDRRFKRQEQDNLRRTADSSRAEQEAVQRGLAALEHELVEVQERQQLLGDADGIEGLAVRAEALQHELEDLNARHRAEREQLDRLRGDRNRTSQRSASVEATLHSRAESTAELRERVVGMAVDIAELERGFDSDTSELDGERTELAEAESRLIELRERRQLLDRDRVGLREQLRSAEVQVETGRVELMRARSRLQSLQEIQTRYQACHGGVQVIMDQREQLAELGAELSAQAGLTWAGSESRLALGSGGGEARPSPFGRVHGIMADFIRAPAHLEPAVSALLGDRLQGVVVDGPITGASGVALLKRLEEGRTTFLPLRAGSRESYEGEAGEPLGWRFAEGDRDAHGDHGGAIEVVDLRDESESADVETMPRAVVVQDRGPVIRPAMAPALASLLGAEGVLGRLTELVEIEPQQRELVDMLFGDTLVVDRLARALELWYRLRSVIPVGTPLPATLVTLEGDRIEPSGVVVGGSSNAIDSALLQQRREIAELEQLVGELELEFAGMQARRQGVAERLDEVERGRETSESEVLEAEKAKVTLAQQLAAGEQARERVTRQLDQLLRTRGELESTLDQRSGELADLEIELTDLRERLPELDEASEQAEARVGALDEARSHVGNSLTEAKIALASWQEQRNALANTRERLGKQIASERDRTRRLGESAEQADTRITDLEQTIATMADQHAELLDEHGRASMAKHEAVEVHDAARLRVDELELSIRNLRRGLEDEREALQEVELGLRELVLERQHLETDIRDRFDAELRSLIIDYHDRGLSGPAERERVKELKQVLARMGEVNLTAIAEYEEVSTRFEYLTRQRDDLEDALTQLQDAIDKIDATTKERFVETFHAVDEMFQKLFPRLFAGGQAKLVLTDPNDILTTGVDILAQPPGKKVSSLELLSGGEKALTAVSLIFGIFLIKASPFCLLDEVDAPLDEANVGRFCDLVRELSQRTQFIIITHNKRTMEIADRLYGVTMQQRGVSKLVSVNMRRAAAEAHYS